jgi:hypothetical protein
METCNEKEWEERGEAQGKRFKSGATWKTNQVLGFSKWIGIDH